MRSLQRWFESAFETFLFNSRLIVILAVVGSLASSVMMFIRGAIVIWHTAKDFFHHATDPHGGEELAIALISSVDSFLFATVLLIFAMGIYELFISKIDPASRTEESRPNWLQIHSLDDLKGAVGKVILMILIVRLFESAVKMKYDSPLHLLYLGLSVLFVAGSLFLQHAAHKHDPKHGGEDGHHGKHAKRDSAPGHAPPHAPHAAGHAPAHPAPVVAHAPVPHAAHLAHAPGALHPDLVHAASMLAHHAPAQQQPPVAPGQPSYPHAQSPAQSPAPWGVNMPPDPNGQPQSTAFIQAPRRY